ncbi:hypothetical protein SUGI_0543760 [Cryptomeria japonica]|nr:hypothetical protein SUGI_0543760 [Cryptomeria japonica]
MLSDENKSEIVCQSFDYPGDTLLPEMRFGGKQKIVSWKSPLDPSPGLFSVQWDPSGAIQFVLKWNNSVQYWETGIWDGKTFSAVPEMINGVFYTLSIQNTSSGFYGYRPRDQCAVYGFCGAYGSCNSNNLLFCRCVEGFIPKDNRAWDSQEWWSSGCVRKSPLNCDTKKSSIDEFIEPGVTLSDDSASSYPASTKADCQKACLRNCSCTAFAFNSLSGPCQIWSGDLLNMHNSPSNSRWTVSIRVAASASPKFHKPPSSSKLKTIIIMSALALALALSLFSFLMWQKYRLPPPVDTSVDSPDCFLRMFSYMELKIATRNFRSKLGSGGFGSVFKGSLPDGTLVAVKKLEGSRQLDKQVRAEIGSLGNIQHANLIRLRGFCAEGPKRLLVYDYMLNGSLNSLLFTSNSKRKRKVLDWKTRFQIALGTARAEADIEEVRRAGTVGLLCIEREEEMRPSMEQVGKMLEGKMEPRTPQMPSSALVDRQADRSETDSYAGLNKERACRLSLNVIE